MNCSKVKTLEPWSSSIYNIKNYILDLSDTLPSRRRRHSPSPWRRLAIQLTNIILDVAALNSSIEMYPSQRRKSLRHKFCRRPTEHFPAIFASMITLQRCLSRGRGERLFSFSWWNSEASNTRFLFFWGLFYLLLFGPRYFQHSTVYM